MYYEMNPEKQMNKKTSLGVHLIIFIYWAVLVLWQNIGVYNARTSVDIIIKIGLVLWLVGGYAFKIHNARVNANHFVILLLFVFTQIITFFSESNVSSDIIISYIFPSLFVFLSFVYGYKYKISIKEYEIFLNCVIVVVAYTALYAVFFRTKYFLNVFSISSGFGNELSSFFVSNHEYGLYLICGIIACIVCLELNKNNRKLKKIAYWLCLFLFIPNLILTFSRTSFLGLAGFLFIYIFYSEKSRLKTICITCLLVGIIICLSSETIRQFVLNIVLKNNHISDRTTLYSMAVQYFNNGTIWQKIFGRGITATRNYFSVYATNPSVHNAYLQVLLYNGIIGLAFMIIFLLNRLLSSIKLIRIDRFWGILNVGLVITCSLIMFTNTTIIFYSPIDSFFLTAFTLVIPKYLENGITYIR